MYTSINFITFNTLTILKGDFQYRHDITSPRTTLKLAKCQHKTKCFIYLLYYCTCYYFLNIDVPLLLLMKQKPTID